jgi:Fe-S cluster biogenesis protein NfuA
MIDAATIAPALEEARSLVQADGGDMELVSTDAGSGTVNLKLILEGASCIECVMPKMFLEQIVLDILQRAGHTVSTVDIYDPREDPNWVAPPEH